jgi:hypothetical protein
MPTKSKDIHFRVTQADYEDLLRILPGLGEMTAFFRSCSHWAIELGPEARLIEQIKRMVHSSEEEEDRWID